MLMRWSDLESGDELKIREEFVRKVKMDCRGNWIDKYLNKSLIIDVIRETSGGFLSIYFVEINYAGFDINEDGTFWNTFQFGQTFPFEIINLHKE